ncbi:MAG: RHS repeat-associated core domain-containing protein [Polyangiaceae bacterium]
MGDSSASWTRTYSYVSGTNRLASNSIPGGTATYTHDPHGSITAMPHLSAIAYSPFDQMVEADLGGGGTAYFTYDAGGQRVRKVHEHSSTLVEERIYLGSYELHRKHDSSSTLLERETLHLTDGTRRVAMVETKTIEDDIAITDPAELWRFQLDNHLGSACLELDDDAAVISYEEYHPYGTSAYRAASASEVSERRYRYIGKERDEETGFYVMGVRYYAAWLGRWTTADPAGIGADGPGLYAYCRGNPVGLRDPGGTDGDKPDLGGFAIEGSSDLPDDPSDPRPIMPSRGDRATWAAYFEADDAWVARHTGASTRAAGSPAGVPTANTDGGVPDGSDIAATEPGPVGEEPDLAATNTEQPPDGLDTFLIALGKKSAGMLMGIGIGLVPLGWLFSPRINTHDRDIEMGRAIGEMLVGLYEIAASLPFIGGGAVTAPAGGVVPLTGGLAIAAEGMFDVASGWKAFERALSMSKAKGTSSGPSNTNPASPIADRKWQPRDIANQQNWHGCEERAREIQNVLGGGTIVRIEPKTGRMLGGYRKQHPAWYYHEVVVKDGRVYDAFTGGKGATIKEYKALWEFPNFINFGF